MEFQPLESKFGKVDRKISGMMPAKIMADEDEELHTGMSDEDEEGGEGDEESEEEPDKKFGQDVKNFEMLNDSEGVGMSKPETEPKPEERKLEMTKPEESESDPLTEFAM